VIFPSLQEILSGLGKHPSFENIRKSCRTGEDGPLKTNYLSGLTPTAKAFYTVLLAQQTATPVLTVVNSNIEADRFTETASAFFDLLEVSDRHAPFVLHSQDVTPYDDLSPHPEISEKRAVGLWRMVDGKASLIVTTIAAVLQKISSADFYRNLGWKLQVNDEFFLEDLESGLLSVGYERRELVDMVGQFSVRGGIIDIYSPEATHPVRLEMLDDQIESIREFELVSQKSLRRVEQVTLLPLTEYRIPRNQYDDFALKDRIDPLSPGWEFHIQENYKQGQFIWELLDNPILVWSERDSLYLEAKKTWRRIQTLYEQSSDSRISPTSYYHKLEEVKTSSQKICQVAMNEVAIETTPGFHIATRPTPRFQGNISHAMGEIQAQARDGARILIMGFSLGDIERLADILGEYEIGFQLVLNDPANDASPFLKEKAYLANTVAHTVVAQVPIRQGAVFPEINTILYGADDLFGTSKLVAHPRKQESAMAIFLPDLQDLSEGDYIVHVEHGIGLYRGTREIAQGNRTEDFMLLEYADGARLYVPLSRLDLIQKYNGSGSTPTLDRMGGQTWRRTKSRVKARLLDMADELLKLYAERKLAAGYAFSPDSNWQREFEDSFEFTETPDQIQTIKDIKHDMESAHPMDRLVCGDVGFGKTEVAMRATFKALGDGKQVAILTPTTVLALQHYETFRSRFTAFPVEIEMLSRLRNTEEQTKILQGLESGKIDVIIGTHRLLSKDVSYSDIGLLVVDEEHRFGVRHKERLKQIKKEVDVLTLSATPIPRTLHMSFAGLRDLSTIQTPPKDRLAINTVVAPHSDRIIETAIRREMDREGQVYFIHNRVESIWDAAEKIQKLAPNARIGVGHGQMAAKELERVMLKLINHKYDILVSTTIVENGLDIPLANTIIIDHAHRYGLADLYQLRGRVGRSNRRAYAFLLVPETCEINETARKRLAALKEFSELGAGFKIAALDLELRGAGNLLGAQQHGQIASVGFETYCRMLNEAVSELQGKKTESFSPTSLKLQLDLHIPPSYISNENQRLHYYKILAEVKNESACTELLEELRDRYGATPTAVENLASFALVKTLAQRIGVASIDRRGSHLRIHFRENSKVALDSLMKFVTATPSASFSPSGELELKLKSENGRYCLDQLQSLLTQLSM
tara:strand:- start:9083 stop:12541 length:3459 start_codon:yes stop_codon:yes gene_type:complete